MIALLILGGLVLLALVAFVSFVVGGKRAVVSFGQPTPAEAKIQLDTAAELEANAAYANAKGQKVQNASKAELIALGRDELSPDDTPTTPGTKNPHGQR